MTRKSRLTLMAVATAALAVTAPLGVNADPAHDAVLKLFGSPSSFSAARGKAFFLGTHTGGKPQTPSCTTCHTKNPRASGRTRVGKVIHNCPNCYRFLYSVQAEPQEVETTEGGRAVAGS